MKPSLTNYPNPFNQSIAGAGRSPETTISFNLDSECEIKLSVYNIKGQKVNSIYEGTIAAGEHNLNWNNGKRLAAGVYIISLKYKDSEIVRKMLLLK
jgi:flagellar hook assembly protein FlgD